MRICSLQTSVCLLLFFFCSPKHSSLDTGVVSQRHNTHTELREQSFCASKAQRIFRRRRCHFKCWWEHCRHFRNRVRRHRFQSSPLCLPASFDVVPWRQAQASSDRLSERFERRRCEGKTRSTSSSCSFACKTTR
uniref:Putative secreted protein n=1 Tax=Ixodes ricinus TaxID=34613 RepID=A0A6B0US40_IXORI